MASRACCLYLSRSSKKSDMRPEVLSREAITLAWLSSPLSFFAGYESGNISP